VTVGKSARAAAVLLAALALALPAAAQEHRAGDIAVERPWARATAGSQANGAAYAVIRNGGDRADRLVGGRSPASRTVELHATTVTPEGVARMRAMEAVEIPPGGEARFEPGGLHVMLVGLAGPLAAGQSFPLTLVFERAGEVTVEVAVEGSRPGAGGGHGHGHEGH
jgi:periplasmic copper chaperone A